MKDSEKKHLRKGELVIVVKQGHELGLKLHHVYRFHRWYTPQLALINNPYYLNHPQLVSFLEKGIYFQVEELLELGYLTHNFDIENFEIFDPKIHKNAILMSAEKYVAMENEFRINHKNYLTKSRNYGN